MELFFAIGAVHGLLVTITALGIIYTDHQGWLYFTGKKPTLSPKFITWSHRLVWLGLALIITTGASLALDAWQYYLTMPAFYLKMGLVGVLLMNAIAIGALAKKAAMTPFAMLTSSEKKTLLVSGGLSFMGWVGAIVIGLFLL